MKRPGIILLVIATLLVVAIGTGAYVMQQYEEKTEPATTDQAVVIEASQPTLSKEARKMIQSKLDWELEMIEYRLNKMEDVKKDMMLLKELVNSLPEDSENYRFWKNKLDAKEHELEGLKERNEDSKKEVRILKSVLGEE